MPGASLRSSPSPIWRAIAQYRASLWCALPVLAIGTSVALTAFVPRAVAAQQSIGTVIVHVTRAGVPLAGAAVAMMATQTNDVAMRLSMCPPMTLSSGRAAETVDGAAAPRTEQRALHGVDEAIHGGLVFAAGQQDRLHGGWNLRNCLRRPLMIEPLHPPPLFIRAQFLQDVGNIRRMPARMIASVQGGVRPAWQQGSRFR